MASRPRTIEELNDALERLERELTECIRSQKSDYVRRDLYTERHDRLRAELNSVVQEIRERHALDVQDLRNRADQLSNRLDREIESVRVSIRERETRLRADFKEADTSVRVDMEKGDEDSKGKAQMALRVAMWVAAALAVPVIGAIVAWLSRGGGP